MLVGVALVLVAFFVVMGLFYMFFFLMTILQRIVQRHVRLLHMRAESKVYRVLDLADRPELLDAPERDARPGGPYDAPHVSLLARDGAKAGCSSSEELPA